MTPRRALVTGAAGQDGVLLARLLAGEGTEVVAAVRQGTRSDARVAAYLAGVPGLEVVELDVTDTPSYAEALARHRPEEVYHLAALTSVGASWAQPELVAEVNGAAVERLLAATIAHRDRTGTEVRFFQASSAEDARGDRPSPYADAKDRARRAVAAARERGLFACTAVLHNHESPLRPRRFVTRTITAAVAEIADGRRDELVLGNLGVTRDWGSAGDHVDAVRRVVRHHEPLDVEVATGVAHTLADLVEMAFAAAGVDDPWSRVTTEPGLLRPSDTAVQVGDPARARGLLGWSARVPLEEVVAGMVRADRRRLVTGVEHSLDDLTGL